MKFRLLLALLCLSSLNAFAGRDRNFREGRWRGGRNGNELSERIRQKIQNGRVMHAGNGCPNDSAQVVFSPDNLSFSIIFDRFVAEATAQRGLAMANVFCNTSIPIQIPAGMQMQIVSVDLRGFVGLPQRARAVLRSSFNLKLSRRESVRMNVQETFLGPRSEDYVASSEIMNDGENERSSCGGSVTLKITNLLTLQTMAPQQLATFSLDSIDGASEAVYHVNWTKCAGQ